MNSLKALVHTFHLLSIFVTKEESINLSTSLKQERTVTNVIDLFHKVSQVKMNNFQFFVLSHEKSFLETR